MSLHSVLDKSRVREVKLAELSSVAAAIQRLVLKSGFQPDCILYLETGARLLAGELCRLTGLGVIPLSIQRKGTGLKDRVAGALFWLPDGLKDFLRRLEARFLWKRMQDRRDIGHLPRTDLSGVRLLIVDDAVDTGSSVRLARDWAFDNGARPENVRVASITVTTALAEGLVDFSLYSEMCRFPWSSDSREREAYLRIYETLELPSYARRSV